MPTKRTTVLLDTDLMADAAHALGTQRASDTVRASLEHTVRQAHVRSLLAWELPETADEELAEQRAPRRRFVS